MCRPPAAQMIEQPFMTMSLRDPVLVEVTPCTKNVQKAPDTAEHWVALDGGTFEACPEQEAFVVYTRAAGVKAGIVKKRRPKRTRLQGPPPVTRSQTLALLRATTDRLAV